MARNSTGVFLASLLLALSASSSSALEINRIFIPAGNAFPDPISSIIAEGQPHNTYGGGDLSDIFNAAADWWESAILDDNTVTISYGWAPLTGTTIGRANYYSPAPSASGTARFNSSGSTAWFLDGTPDDHFEYATFTAASAELGGGVVNTRRNYEGATGNASGRFDLYSVALHEIGHVLGVDSIGNWGTPYPTPSNLPFAGTLIPRNDAHIDIVTANMYPTFDASQRKQLTAIDVLAVAQNSGYESIDTNPYVSPKSKVFVSIGNEVYSYGVDGTALSAFNRTAAINAIARVGEEMWIGIGNDVYRHQSNGTVISFFNPTPAAIGAIAPVGGEVWVGSGNDVYRYDLNGNFLSYFNPTPATIGAITRVENEVWVGSGNDVYRYDLDGNFLSYFNPTPASIGALAIVGDEVWVGTGNDVYRYGSDGAFLSYFNPTPAPVGAIAVVDDVVWVGTGNDVHRYDIDGNYISYFNPSPDPVVAIAATPQPSSVSTGVLGDTDRDGDVDTADLTAALQNFTGDGGSGKTYLHGDTDFDGDVDTADLTRAFQNFTGAIEADLLYDPATGNMRLDASESPGGLITQFLLTNAAGGEEFNTGAVDFPFEATFQTNLPTEIRNADGTGVGFTGIWDLGNIFPIGLDETGLFSFLTSATYGGTPGTGASRPFDLVVVVGSPAPVPEPGSLSLCMLGGALALMSTLGFRRRKYPKNHS